MCTSIKCSGCLKLWVPKTVGTYSMASQNFVGVLKICGYSKIVGTCTQNLNFVGTRICGYSKFVGAQNLFLLKFCGT